MTSDQPMSLRRRKGQKPDILNRSLLHLAAERGRIELLRCLLVPGSAVNLRDKRGQTPLHSAAVGGNPSCVRALIQAGVSIEATDRSGQTAIDLAVRHGHSACTVWLLCLGACLPRRRSSSKENHELSRILATAEAVCEASPDAVRDAESRRILMRKEFSWRKLSCVCKNPADELQKATGLPKAILDDIVVLYGSEFAKKSSPELAPPICSSSSDEWEFE